LIKSPLERLGWLTSMAADRKIKESAHKVALYLASCCNKNSGLCNPMQDVIELHTGLCEKSVKNGIAQLKNGGYLKTKRKGKLNHYTLLIPYSAGRCDLDSMPSQGQAVTPETISQGQAVTSEIKVKGKLVPSQGQAGSEIGVTGCPCIEQGKNKVRTRGVITPKGLNSKTVVDLYHQHLPMCPAVRKLTKARETQIKARLSQDLKTEEAWTAFFKFVADSHFLTGQSETNNGRKPFFADLEWLTRESNFVKVIEGKYE
jgi:hypothetical protein